MTHAPATFRPRALALLWVALAISACTTAVPNGEQPPREQTRLDIKIKATDEVNPDAEGRAAPILVRVYELRSLSNFENADYYSLNKDDKKVLGEDMLAKDEFIMRPGDQQVIRRASNPNMRAIGVLAGYRDLPHAVWRVVQKAPIAPEAAWYRTVVPNNKMKLDVLLQDKAVQVTPAP